MPIGLGQVIGHENLSPTDPEYHVTLMNIKYTQVSVSGSMQGDATNPIQVKGDFGEGSEMS